MFVRVEADMRRRTEETSAMDLKWQQATGRTSETTPFSILSTAAGTELQQHYTDFRAGPAHHAAATRLQARLPPPQPQRSPPRSSPVRSPALVQRKTASSVHSAVSAFLRPKEPASPVSPSPRGL